jgi:hypothetical protein
LTREGIRDSSKKLSFEQDIAIVVSVYYCSSFLTRIIIITIITQIFSFSAVLLHYLRGGKAFDSKETASMNKKREYENVKNI